MKKIFVLLSLLVLATSCDWFEFDNQESWNAQVEGKFLDSKTGELMQFAFPNSSKISIYEEGWDAEKAQTWIKNGAQPTDTVRGLLKKAGVL